MYRNNNHSLIFSSDKIFEKFESAFKSIKSIIEREKEDDILNENETKYTNHLASKYSMDVPEIMFNNVCIDSYEEDIPAEYFPLDFNIRKGKKYKKWIIQYIIPVKGNACIWI